MTTIILKLALTPMLIGVASLVGRRWGPAISGWLIGLPFTSGPIIFLLALAHGAAFAAAAATGTLAGVLSEAAFCIAYGWLAWRGGWVWAVLGGSLAFIGATAALQGVSLAPVPLCMIGLIALVATLYLLPTKRRGGRGERASTAATPTTASIPRWDLPARMLVATGFVVLLTGIAPALGPHLTGLIAPFPVFATILAAFAQRQSGPAAAVGVLHGLLLGLFSFAAFFLTLALLLVPLGVALAFVGAIVSALIVQGGSFWLMQRRAASAPAL